MTKAQRIPKRIKIAVGGRGSGKSIGVGDIKDQKRLEYAEKRQAEIHQAQLGRQGPRPSLLAMSVRYHIHKGRTQ